MGQGQDGTLVPPAPDMALTWTDGERVFYRASGVGSCLRDLVASRLDYPQDPMTGKMGQKVKNWMREGKIHEPHVIEDLYDHHIVVQDTQMEIVVQVTEQLFIVGHIDGIVTQPNPDRAGPCEVKTVGQWTWDNKVQKLGVEGFLKDNRRYAFQFTTYCAGAGYRQGLYAVKNRNTGETVWEWVDAPLDLEAPGRRVELAEGWVERGSLCPCDSGCGQWDTRYWHIHEKKKVDVQRVKDAHKEAQVAAYYGQKQQLDYLTRELKGLRDGVKEVLGEGTHDVGEYRVTVESVTQKRLDSYKARTLLGDEAEQAEVEVTSERVTVKRRKDVPPDEADEGEAAGLRGTEGREE